MPTVTVHHDDGSTETIPTTTGWELKETIGQMWRQTITVERSLANDVSLTKQADEIELGGYKRGVLADIQTGGAEWTLVVYSPEWYATLTEPTPGGTEVQGTDVELTADQIAAVDEWSEGTLVSNTGPMTFVLSHQFRHEALRKFEKNIPGEYRFDDDGTVNLLSALGTDRSADVELSPSSGLLEQRISVLERGRKLNATHVRVIGAHEGEAQRFATLVPDDDPATYENRVDYTTPRWDPGDPRDWDRWQNKDVMAQDTIEEEAASLGEELPEEYVEVETTVSGVDLNLGDWVQVVKPDAGIDRRMRVHQLVTRPPDDSTAGVVQDVTLSTRTVAREDLGEDRRDIQRFNTAFQGSSVAINVGPDVSAIDNGDPVTIPFYYPDLEFENNAELQIRGLNYRIDSVGAASSGGAHDHEVTFPDHDHEFTYGVNQHSHIIPFVLGAETDEAEGHVHGYDKPDNSTTIDVNDTSTTTTTTEGGGGTTETSTEVTPSHSHPPEPGIYTTGDTPSNVDVYANGTLVASDIGSGTFEVTIDAADEFTPDAWNEIEIRSDSLGRVQTTAFLEGYDQIGTQ